MLALLLTTAVTTTSKPAFAACHKYTHWAYPFKQRCPAHAVRYVASVPPPPARPTTQLDKIEKIDVTIPLPGLNNIDWGRPADEDTIGRVLLRAKLGGQ